MKNKLLSLSLIMLALILVACGDKTSESGKELEEGEREQIYISAAASLTDAVDEIIELAEDELKVEFITNYGSSGALQTQIEEGAPVDIFMSAGEKQMDALEEKGLVSSEFRETMLENEVVLITPKNSDLSLNVFEDVLKDDVEKIAISDPSSVPVGQYSEEIFTNLGIWDEVKAKMVQSQDVRQSLDWVVSGNVDCGTVYKTDALIEEENVNIVAKAPVGSHKPVAYPVAIVGESVDREVAKAFYDFLKTESAKEVFEKYGFVVKD
ncbi:molybdate ABC transporter substrate-binding protein [Anaerosphaera multitolerans]|uniref:Molybdate ABC transporter substrate-binding protein n=1 Tax=Anaerosphaera multitolerans TaxID=2487351 RepID=A0A437S542_9FIRM|nr:molybdate ABC transporter substrate-binding protein [Anaerosphaera multitolerans]RVU54130.1 molybdate ABC transporter substrate-binding protein [Anaerosphaera multitolerans]